MRKCKKVIQADLGIFTNIQGYSGKFRQTQTQAFSGIIQAYSEPCVTLAYSESWHTQNQVYIQNSGIPKSLAY